MKVSVVQEWRFPEFDTQMDYSDPNNSMFYVVLLQDKNTKVRYIKVGTSTRTVNARFNDASYKRYSFKKFLYVAELACDKKQNKDACKHVEDLTRSAIREMKGFTFVAEDRFKYFNLPEQIPVVLTFDEKFFIDTKKSA